MANFVRILSVDNIATVHKRFGRAIALARDIERTYARTGNPRAIAAAATLRELQLAYADFNRDVGTVARDTAAMARKEMATNLARTRQRPRPDTGLAPHLRNALRARPVVRFGALATGEVGIADIEVLDQVVNPITPEYGPYWRAQEYGTTKHVGRVIYGGFYGAGGSPGPFKPDAAFRGNPGPHPVFITRARAGAIASSVGLGGPKGGGKMTIHTPLKARHFIRDGADAAEAVWRRDLAVIEQRAFTRIAAVTSPAALAGTRGRRR